MQANASLTEASEPVAHGHHRGRGTYTKVFGPGKRRIRGLWKRNDAFYAQLTLTGLDGKKAVRRVRLEDTDGNPVSTLAAAIKAMAAMATKRDEDTLELTPKRTPTFADAAAEYIAWLRAVGDVKRPKTVNVEESLLAQFEAWGGHLRLREITTKVLQGYQAHRKAQGKSARTVNLEIVAVRNVLRRGLDHGTLRAVPSVKPLKAPATSARLLKESEILKVCAAAEKHYRTGKQVADFVKLMAYSGGRWGETIRLRWQDVDFNRRQLHFGADGLSKNGEERVVDFNDKLEAHLKDMQTRCQPDSQFLFPSSRRGDQDVPTLTFNAALRGARIKAGVPDFHPHLCRHFFASFCVMSGLDFMTTARWLGHKDGGILIGRTYGHLASEHMQAQAARLTFKPQIVERKEAL